MLIDSNGIKCSGDTVYIAKHRDRWREKLLKNKITHLIVEELWIQLDQLSNSKNKLKRHMRIQSRQYPEIK